MLRHIRTTLTGLTAVLMFVAALAGLNRALDRGGGCAECGRPTGDGFTARLRVTDETGRPVARASVQVYGPSGAAAPPVRVTTGRDGVARTPSLSGPAVAVVSTARHLPEPVLIGRSDHVMDVRLLARGPHRFVMHSAGDVMFGRRYQTPIPGRTPLVPGQDAADGARGVVSSIAPLFRAADLRTVNLESVLGDRPADHAYPGKRYVLRSPAASTAGLRALGVDAAVLANNHTRDFLDGGVADTRAALTRAGVGSVGAGPDPDQAARPYLRSVAGVEVGVAAYTSVDGSFVNDRYPRADVAGKADWQVEPRMWGFTDGRVTIPHRSRRIGDAWRVYRDAEPRLDRRTAAALWGSLQRAYPGLQDWVSRRGHGGPAMWDPRTSPARIRELAGRARLVVVQFHSGFQFQEASSDNLRTMARQAIDAGADIVIAHHPHVLQGMEWYKGRLIAYSLGNFVFDQDFLATFSSAILRTVWDGDHLVQARAIPIELVGYRPVPVVDSAAVRALGRLAERSSSPAVATRDPSGAVRAVPLLRDTFSRPARLVLEGHTALITTGSPPLFAQRLTVGGHGVARIPADLLSRAGAGVSPGVEVGRDLFGWGDFEEETADPSRSPVHWQVNSALLMPRDAPAGRRFLRLTAGNALVRPVARVPLPRHRVYGRSALPADGMPGYSLRVLVRRSPGAGPFARLVIYHFDDSDPTEDPRSTQVKTLERAIDAPTDGRWHQVSIDVGARDLDKGNLRGNAVMPYLGTRRSADGAGPVDIDQVEFVEWRRPSGQGFARYDLVRNKTGRPLSLPLQSFGLAGRRGG